MISINLKLFYLSFKLGVAGLESFPLDLNGMNVWIQSDWKKLKKT